MEFADIAVVAGVVVAYGLVSRRLVTTPVTGPIVFVGAGMVLGPDALGIIDLGIDQGAVRVLAEVTLVLLLFTDAVRIDLDRLRHQAGLPARLLLLGLPLTVLAGTVAALGLFPAFGFWEAMLLAAILTPTDAALAAAIVTNPRVPIRVRQALNVESGLNDGIMLPVITLFLALAAASEQLESASYWAQFLARQIGLGVLVGAAAGLAGGTLIDRFSSKEWMEGAFRQLATLAVGIGAFAAAEAVTGNGFVAAFVAGLAFGATARPHCQGAYEFATDEAELLALLTFLFFGATVAGPALGELTWQIAVFAALCLTVVRLIPVAISLTGSGLQLPTVAYVAWFGPRGLASIVFGLFILEEAALAGGDAIFLVVTFTVLASVVLHGVTSYALSERYAVWFAARVGPLEEAQEVEAMPLRGRAPR